MAITRLSVAGYRSLRRCSMQLSRLTVVVGPNGCGKTNLYRAMLLLASAARGEFARQIVGEGGMRSALWAGDRRKGPVRLTLGAALEELEYELSAGLPPIEKPEPDGPPPLFMLDPCVKVETIRARTGHRLVEMLNRKGGTIWARDAAGKRVTYPFAINEWETVLGELSEPHAYPEIGGVRQELRGWRFYHSFRTDADSPLRQPQIGTRTPVLSHDGFDLAAALGTILEIGDYRALNAAVDDAFPGAALWVEPIGVPERGIIPPGNRLQISFKEQDFGRPFSPLELSDGTLRYLCLLAALLSPRPPALLALNEPETSIHPRLIEPLGRLIEAAAERSQVWVTTHSEALAAQLARASGAEPIRLEKVAGETRVVQAVDDGWAPAEDEEA